MVQPLNGVLHHFAQLFEVDKQPGFVQFLARQRDPHLVIVSMRIFALTLVIAQVVPRRERVFHGNFEHESSHRPRHTSRFSGPTLTNYCTAMENNSSPPALDSLPIPPVACQLGLNQKMGALIRMPRRIASILVVVIAALVAHLPAQTQPMPVPPPFDVRAHYTKYEFRIKMRDGVHLFTSVYV